MCHVHDLLGFIRSKRTAEQVNLPVGKPLLDDLVTGMLSLEDLAPRIRQLRQHQEQLQTTRWEMETVLSDRKVELGMMRPYQSMYWICEVY